MPNILKKITQLMFLKLEIIISYWTKGTIPQINWEVEPME